MSYFSFDKIRLILQVTWVWAWIGLQMAKLFEVFFKLLLKLPNGLLSIIDTSIKTSDNKLIQIINAYDDKERNITHKFKLFLSQYWDSHMGAFDFQKLSELLECTAVFCSYLSIDTNDKADDLTNVQSTNATSQLNTSHTSIKDDHANSQKELNNYLNANSNASISYDYLVNNMQHMFLDIMPDGSCYKSHDESLNDRTPIEIGYVNFDNTDYKKEDYKSRSCDVSNWLTELNKQIQLNNISETAKTTENEIQLNRMRRINKRKSAQRTLHIDLPILQETVLETNI